jgi:hypothetical protein
MPYRERYYKVFLKILEVVNFKGNKEGFIEQFCINVYLQSLIDLTHSLSLKEREELVMDISASRNNAEDIAEIIKRCFGEEQRLKATKVAATNALIKYVSTILPVLSSLQEQKIINFFQEFSLDL